MILKRGMTGCTAGDLSLERDWYTLRTAFKRASYAAFQQVNGRVIEHARAVAINEKCVRFIPLHQTVHFFLN